MPGNHAERKAQVRNLFNSVSQQYDAGPGCFAYFGRRLVDAAKVAAGERVLDVASGRGAVLFPAAERLGKSGEAEGVDLSEEMVRLANDEAARRGLPARASLQDAERLAFPDASFDRVLCGFGVMFFPDQDAALREFKRVLKRAGTLAVSTWCVSQAEELSRLCRELGFRVGEPPGWITEPQVLERLVARNGFSDVRVRKDAHTFRYAGLDEYWQQAMGTGLRGLLMSLDEAARQNLREAFAERMKPHQRPDGLYLEASALIAVATT